MTPLGIKPTVDFAFKKIFGSPDNVQPLIGLLNAVLDRRPAISEVHILNPFNVQDFAGDKLVVLDLRARDASGELLNIEMQVSPHQGLLQRLVYYAAELYTEQLTEGDAYSSLHQAISICLISHSLFKDSEQPHHRFQQIDLESGRELSDGIEVHTVELPKYHLDRRTIAQASPIEQWAFFLLHADQYSGAELRNLLPSIEHQQAITVVESIFGKQQDRLMYDQRLKAERDHRWMMESARAEAREQGLEAGLEQGVVAGKIQALQEVLGDRQQPTEELAKLAPKELERKLAALQTRLNDRTP